MYGNTLCVQFQCPATRILQTTSSMNSIQCSMLILNQYKQQNKNGQEKGYYTLACFVFYLKIIDVFWKIYYASCRKYPKNFKEFKGTQAVRELLMKIIF